MSSTRRTILFALLLAAAIAASAMPSSAVDLPANFALLDIGSGATFEQPVAVAFAPDGRIFVVERRGRIYVLAPDPGAPDPRTGYTKIEPPFLSIEADVLDNWDRGMLAIALDPEFATNGYVYFAYVAETNPAQPDYVQDAYSKVERIAASVSNPDQADLATRQVLIGETWTTGVTSSHTSHTVGSLVFGDDGTLLFSHGDGAHFDFIDAGGNDPELFLPGRSDPMEDVGAFRAQYLGSMSGKVLRIDPATGDGVPGNPYYDALAPRSPQSRVWASGVRNPFRMDLRRGSGSTDPADAQPGLLAIGDVGLSSWEEVNLVSGGENLGWPCYEGNGEQPLYQLESPMHSGCPPDDSGITDPLLAYPHGGSASEPFPGLSGVAVVGATFHAGTNYPMAYRDLLYVAEYGQRWVYGLRLDTTNQATELVPFATDTPTAVELRHDPWSGDLFTIDYSSGRVQRYAYEGPDGIGTDPAQPQALTAVADGGAIRLKWEFNAEVDVIGYHVYRATSESGPWTKVTIEPVADRAYVDDGSVSPLAIDTIYWYQIEAVDNEVPARTSIRSASSLVIYSSQNWEWYVPHPGPTMTLTDVPAPFPRQLALPDPFVQPNYDFWSSTDRAPQLRTFDLPAGDFTLEADVELVEYFNGRDFHAGIVVGFSQYDAMIWGFYRGTGLRLERSGVGPLGNAANASDRVQLRVVRTGTQLSFQYRTGAAAAWQVGVQYSTPSTPTFVGVIAKAWQNFTIPLTLDVHSLGVDEIAPVAVAVADPVSGPAPLSVDFTSGSFDPDGNLLMHSWNFGGGQFSTETNPSFVFTTPGAWPVVLTVKDAAGYTSSDTVTVMAEGNFPPTASIIAPSNGFEYTDPFAPIALAASVADVEDPAASLTVSWSVDLHHGAQDTLGYRTPAPGPTSSFVPGIADDGQGITLDIVLTVTDTDGASVADTITVVDASLPPIARLDLRAALADGVTAPAVPGASGPWANLGLAGTGADAALTGFAATVGSGWNGAGAPGDPLHLRFDGVDDVAVVAAGAIGSLDSGATLELRMRTPSDVTARAYVAEWIETFAPPFPGCSLAIENGKLRLYLGGWVDLIPVVPDRWYHVLVAKEPGAWHAWVDGVEVASGSGANLGDQVSEFVLGAGTFAGNGVYAEHFDGAIAEVRVFDFAVSTANASVLSSIDTPLYANAPRVTAVTPAAAENDEPATGVQVGGMDFADGATVVLERTGQSPIVASAVQFVDASLLTVDFPLTGAVAGAWTLRVVNPDGQSGALTDAFAVLDPSPLFLELLASHVDGDAPPAVPSAQSPWISRTGGVPLDLLGFAGDLSSGWQGDGAYEGPFRLRFDGSDDLVQLAPSALVELDTLTELSAELWVRPAPGGNASAVLLEWAEAGSPAKVWSLSLQGDSLRLRHDDTLTRSLSTIQADAWTQITITQDTDAVRAYIDGVQVYDGIGALVAAQDSALVIGADFAGEIAIVRLARSAFDAATVAARHAQDQALFDALPQALLSLNPTSPLIGASDSIAVELRYDDQGDPFGLRGGSLRVDYDPSLLTLLEVEEGELLSSAGSSFFSIDSSQAGVVDLDMALLGSTAGANGAGRLAVLVFAHSVAAADTTISLQLTVSELVDVQDPPLGIPHRVTDPNAIRIDALAPPPLLLLEAAAGDSAAVVHWTRPVEEPVDVLVFTRPWSLDTDQGFPLFGRASAAPAWPNSAADALQQGWTLTVAGQTDSIASTDSMIIAAGRTVLSVIASTRDLAGNVSDLTLAPRVRTATHRITDLGEIDGTSTWQPSFDGFVDHALDVEVLAATYGALATDPGFLPVADFAPTSDTSIGGWPQPDGFVGFGELILFALDFEPEQAATESTIDLEFPAAVSPVKVGLGHPVSMAPDRVRFSVSLSGNPGSLRALHVPVHFAGSGAALLSVEPVSAWASEIGFAGTYARGDSVIVDVAVLGSGVSLEGDGPIAWYEFAHTPGSLPNFSFGSIVAYALDGSPTVVEGSTLPPPTDVPTTVAVTRLHAATPNPFNPRTTLRFDLARGGRVGLRVYDVAGRLVRVLADRVLEAGSHATVWDGWDDAGRQVASGVYLYELQTPEGDRIVKKMSLVK